MARIDNTLVRLNCPSALRLRAMTSLTRRLAAVLLFVCATGCVCTTKHAVPAYRLPEAERLGGRSHKVTVDLSLLGQPQPETHRVGPGDVLSVYIYGVLPPDIEAAPVIMHQVSGGAQYYPPNGALLAPTLGVPMEVQHDGHLMLPLVGRVDLTGMTLPQVRDAILKSYQSQEVLQQERERVAVSLVRPRVKRVVVIRSDVASEMPQLIVKGAVPFTKRGRADIVDLPAFENDVLHALSATGGLPGIDAQNEVWILRNGQGASSLLGNTVDSINQGADLDGVLATLQATRGLTRIPLSVSPGAPLPFAPEDVLLGDGDIVYLAPREEFYYTGGLLVGGQIPLPRDYDIDVLEAITTAGGSIGGPGGAGGAVTVRAGAGPGQIIPPTRVMVLRKLPDGRQLAIRVDLKQAMRDPVERIVIRPDDMVMLYYKPHELVGNVALNFFNLNFVLTPENLK